MGSSRQSLIAAFSCFADAAREQRLYSAASANRSRTMKKLVAVLLPWLASCHAQHINYPYSTVPTAAPTAQTLTAFGIYATPTIIRASDYGVLPGNSATTNDTAFAALNAVLTASPSTVWEVVFAPGTYQYTNNRWLWN